MEFAFKLEFLADQIVERGILKRVSTASSEGVDMFCRDQDYSIVLALAASPDQTPFPRGAANLHPRRCNRLRRTISPSITVATTTA